MRPGGGRRWTRGLPSLPLACALLLSGATPARADWPATTAERSATSVQAMTVPSVGTVNASRAVLGLGLAVSVTWNPVTVNGVAVRGYEVLRYRTVAGVRTPDTTTGGCSSSLLTTTTCTDTGSLLGLAGTLSYTVTPLFATNWRGTPVTSNTA